MSAWTEDDSATYREIADVAVPRREEMIGDAGRRGAVRAPTSR